MYRTPEQIALVGELLKLLAVPAPRVRPFRFLADPATSPTARRSLRRRTGQSRSATTSWSIPTTSSCRSGWCPCWRPSPPSPSGSGLRVRRQQRPAAPGAGRPGHGVARRDQRRPRGGRDRRRLERAEYEALGMPFEPIGRRIDRLTEAVAVIKGCFGDGPFASRASTTRSRARRAAEADPAAAAAAVHRWRRQAAAHAGRARGGHRRRWRRGRSRALEQGRRPLRPRSITVAATEEKLGWIREAAGDRFDDLEVNAYPSGTSPILTDHARKDGADVLDGIRTGPASRSRWTSSSSPRTCYRVGGRAGGQAPGAARAARHQLDHGRRPRHPGPVVERLGERSSMTGRPRSLSSPSVMPAGHRSRPDRAPTTIRASSDVADA